MGILVLAIYLILVGLVSLFGLAVPQVVIGLGALISGILLLAENRGWSVK